MTQNAYTHLHFFFLNKLLICPIPKFRIRAILMQGKKDIRPLNIDQKKNCYG